MKKTDIYVTYGSDYVNMAKELCEKSNLHSMIGDTQMRIGIKPNLVVAKKADDGATTHSELVQGAIEYLLEHGFKKITILEGSWVGARTSDAFKICGYTELSQRYGVNLLDTQKDTATTFDCKGMNIDICTSALNIDFMINMPVMKGHCQAKLTCALKNNKGLIPNSEKRRFHTLDLNTAIAHLNTAIRHDFILVDAICGDIDFEEGGNPLRRNMAFAAADPVLCDAYAATLLGYDVASIAYILMAEKLNIGSADLTQANITYLNEPCFESSSQVTGKIKELSKYINENCACSACYASLIHALLRLKLSGRLSKLPDKICIGQGFKNKTGNIGIGKCTASFENTVPGCPPSANAILKYLQEL